MSSKNAKAYTNIHAQTVRWGWGWGRRTDVREEKEGKKAKENRPQRCRREKRVWRGETDRREKYRKRTKVANKVKRSVGQYTRNYAKRDTNRGRNDTDM